MKKIILLVLALIALSVIPASAQDTLMGADGKLSYAEWKRHYALRQYEKLKNGALLVRLKTQATAIEALRKRGQNESAARIAENQRQENERIVSAFRDNFDFAPVYFFYSDDSRYLLNNEPGKVTFLMPDLSPVDTVVAVEPEKFVVAEFSTVSAEPRAYYENYRREYKGQTDSLSYINSSEMGFTALVLYNDDLQQLTDPFPYYVRMYRGLLFFERSYGKAVSILDHRLTEL